MPPTRLTKEQLVEAWDRRQAGWTYRQLANEYDSWPSNIRRMLIRHFLHDGPFGGWRATFTLPTDPTELGYLAGIIDGEGNIQKITGLKSGKAWTVRVRMTDTEVIERLGAFGGKVYYFNGQTEGRKPTSEWNISRRTDVATLLEGILPYLSVPEKRRRAKLALEAARS